MHQSDESRTGQRPSGISAFGRKSSRSTWGAHGSADQHPALEISVGLCRLCHDACDIVCHTKSECTQSISGAGWVGRRAGTCSLGPCVRGLHGPVPEALEPALSEVERGLPFPLAPTDQTESVSVITTDRFAITMRLHPPASPHAMVERRHPKPPPSSRARRGIARAAARFRLHKRSGEGDNDRCHPPRFSSLGSMHHRAVFPISGGYRCAHKSVIIEPILPALAP